MLAGTDRLDQIREQLRSAHPNLIIHLTSQDDLMVNFTPYICDVDPGWDEIISEGYEHDHRPVYWRIVRREEETFACETFLMTRDEVAGAWGAKGLAYCDPETGVAAVRAEHL